VIKGFVADRPRYRADRQPCIGDEEYQAPQDYRGHDPGTGIRTFWACRLHCHSNRVKQGDAIFRRPMNTIHSLMPVHEPSSRCSTPPLNAKPRLRQARINRKFATTISKIAQFTQGGGDESMVVGGSSFGGSRAG
jgi:hypothetical protein